MAGVVHSLCVFCLFASFRTLSSDFADFLMLFVLSFILFILSSLMSFFSFVVGRFGGFFFHSNRTSLSQFVYMRIVYGDDAQPNSVILHKSSLFLFIAFLSICNCDQTNCLGFIL